MKLDDFIVAFAKEVMFLMGFACLCWQNIAKTAHLVFMKLRVEV